ncbi:MAG: hypothetical protein M3Q95_02850 [Bacteroidota bacterium]|nr:hypothetical protein [Bacteroidota bacterium]
MDSKKSKKIRSSQRQRFSMRFVIAAGISAAFIALVFVLYFQFFQNEVTKAKNTETLTPEHLPVDFNIESTVIVNTDTLTRNGSSYKVARPLSQTPPAPVQ